MKGMFSRAEYGKNNKHSFRMFMALILAFMMLMSLLVGCGKNKQGTESEEITDEQTTDNPAAETDAEPESDHADTPPVDFHDDEYTYSFDKALVEGLNYGTVAYNDDYIVYGHTEYNPDTYSEGYPDNATMLEVKYYDYEGNPVDGFLTYNDSSDSYYDFNLDSKGNVYFIHAIQNYDDSYGYFTAYELVAYDKTGKLVDSVIFEDAGFDFMVKDIAIDAKDRLLVLTNEGIMECGGGQTKNKINYDDADSFGSFYPMEDGDVAVLSYGYEDYEISVINIDSRSRKDLGVAPLALCSQYSINQGYGTDALISSDNGVYSFNFEDLTYETVMKTPVTDRLFYGLYCIKMLPDKNILGFYYDDVLESYIIARFKPYDISTDTRQKLILDCIGLSPDVMGRVIDFNNTNDDYRILVHDYASLGLEYDYRKGAEMLNADIASGKAHDIMVVTNAVPYMAYMHNGVFADQKMFIEADPSVNIDDYAPNVIEAMSVNDKLMMFTPGFTINTAFAKSTYVGEKLGYSLTDFLSTCGWTGADMYSDVTDESLMYSVIHATGNDYIDWENLSCDFDSTDFVKLLSYTGKYPSEYDYSYDGQEHEDPYNSYALPYREGKALCEIRTLYDIDGYIEALDGVFGEDVTMVGFPTTSDVGSSIAFDYAFAIYEDSVGKDGAWQFVREFYDKDVADKLNLGLPTSDKRLRKAIKDAGGKYKNYASENEYTWEDPTYLVGSEYVNLHPLDKKETDKLLKSIYGINRLSFDDLTISDIITQETDAYYMGAYDAETAAKAIDEKVSKYLEGLK